MPPRKDYVEPLYLQGEQGIREIRVHVSGELTADDLPAGSRNAFFEVVGQRLSIGRTSSMMAIDLPRRRRDAQIPQSFACFNALRTDLEPGLGGAGGD